MGEETRKTDQELTTKATAEETSQRWEKRRNSLCTDWKDSVWLS